MAHVVWTKNHVKMIRHSYLLLVLRVIWTRIEEICHEIGSICFIHFIVFFFKYQETWPVMTRRRLILERCEDLTKKTSKRKFVPVSFCLEIKEKFYRENRGIDARRKRSWDGVFFATNRSVGKRLRMARWHLTFSPFFHHPRRPRRFLLYPFAGCFKPEQYDWIIEAHTASSGYRLEVKSLRGMEAERHLEVCIPKMDFDIWPSPPGILIERVDFTHEITLCATHCEYFQLPFAGHVHTPKRLKNWTVHSVYFS